jgi:predicted RNA binding protein YcfA (HicA-like mRNA interferase family)
MKLPPNVGGHDLAAALCRRWGYEEVNQAGTHINLQTQKPTAHRVATPAHKALRVGTLNGILRDH